MGLKIEMASNLKSSTSIRPRYIEMIVDSIKQLGSRTGNSRQAILARMRGLYSLGKNEAKVQLNLKLALKKGLDIGYLKMARKSGKGSGCYRLGELKFDVVKAANRSKSKLTKISIRKLPSKKSSLVKSKSKSKSVKVKNKTLELSKVSSKRNTVRSKKIGRKVPVLKTKLKKMAASKKTNMKT